MRNNNFSRARRKSESGQAMLFVLLGLGLFLIGAMAFAIDLSNLWFHRQAAQTAADAACTAGAMDLLRVQTNNITGTPYPGNFVPGTNFDCNSTTPNNTNTNPAPCVYAALNGYGSTVSQATAAAGSLGDNVSVIFNGVAPPGVTATKVMEVDVTDNLPTFFAGMLEGKRKQSVRAVAKCGIQQDTTPIPLLVLDPLNPNNKTSAFDISGNPPVTVFGGPVQSIQVNSSDAAAVNINGSALVDLTQGGPQNNGSSLGVAGGPIQPPTCGGGKGFCTGTTSGSWMSPHSPIQDPLQNTAAPTTTGMTTYSGPTGGTVADGVNGCSAKGGTCDVYLPGVYTGGICLGTSCPGKNLPAAIFKEGLYYLQGDLTMDPNSCARISTLPSPSPYNGWGGVMFYFSGTTALNVAANSGNSTSGCGSVFTTATGGPTGFGVSCDSNSQTHVPTNLPATLTGNVLLAPCTGPFGDPYLAETPSQTPPSNPGTQRGVLFFQDRSAQGVIGTLGGGGSYAMAGTFYFHSCVSTGVGTGCTMPTGTYSTGQYFNDTLTMGGNSGAQAYILGEIIVDNLSLQGGPSIYMDLNPSSALNVFKAALYQ